MPISTVNGASTTGGSQALVVSNLVNGNAVLAALAPSVTPCVCEFTRWGAWSIQTNRDNGDGSVERDRMHLGWWFAGRLSDPAQVPTTGTATYNGQLIGSVKNSTTGAEYVSAGKLQYNANFASPSASTMTVTNFDGVNYGGTVGFDRTRNTAAGFNATPGIAGTIPRTGGAALTGATMDVGGAFYQGRTDPIKDVAGAFAVRANPTGTNHNYIAGGIFAGSR